ncbi:MAG: hypothetical protein IAE63_02410 [Alphaproteobacteria bacterium]|jgi:hypothetical protein|nr:hypothetical protein [Alphaproteobacteria bacterium]
MTHKPTSPFLEASGEPRPFVESSTSSNGNPLSQKQKLYMIAIDNLSAILGELFHLQFNPPYKTPIPNMAVGYNLEKTTQFSVTFQLEQKNPSTQCFQYQSLVDFMDQITEVELELAEEQDQSTTIQIDYAPNKDTVKIHFADLPRAIDVLEKMAQKHEITTFDHIQNPILLINYDMSRTLARKNTKDGNKGLQYLPMQPYLSSTQAKCLENSVEKIFPSKGLHESFVRIRAQIQMIQGIMPDNPAYQLH